LLLHIQHWYQEVVWLLLSLAGSGLIFKSLRLWRILVILWIQCRLSITMPLKLVTIRQPNPPKPPTIAPERKLTHVLQSAPGMRPGDTKTIFQLTHFSKHRCVQSHGIISTSTRKRRTSPIIDRLWLSLQQPSTRPGIWSRNGRLVWTSPQIPRSEPLYTHTFSKRSQGRYCKVWARSCEPGHTVPRAGDGYGRR